LNATLEGQASPENAFNLPKGENSYLVKAGQRFLRRAMVQT
jgi:hypothetical protein